MKKVLLFCLIITTIQAATQEPQLSPHIITFFFQDVPHHLKTFKEDTSKRPAGDPRKLLKELYTQAVKSAMISGIYATYAGFLDHSDLYGQIMFDRKTSQPTQTILITPDIKPIPISPTQYNTILGFMINPNAPAQQYLFERKEDPASGPTWTVTEQPVNYKKAIPFDTIIIFKNPEHLLINTGTTRAIPGQNLVLPDIYVLKNPDSILNAFKLLKLRNYFAPVAFKNSFDALAIRQRVTRK